jgi:signal transduction histidine kinase
VPAQPFNSPFLMPEPGPTAEPKAAGATRSAPSPEPAPGVAPSLPRPKRSRVWLARGESVVARTGLGAAVVLLLTVGGLTFWTAKTEHRSAVDRRTGEMVAAGELLARGAEALLVDGNVSSVRTLVGTAGVRHGLTTCRIVLMGPQERVIAEGTGPGIRLQSSDRLPEVWGATSQAEAMAAGEPAVQNLGAEGLSVTVPMFVPGRGPARLEMASARIALPWRTSDALAGVGAIAAAGMLGTLMMYRASRRRLRALGAINDALAGTDETGADALAINPELGPIAVAWNRVLADHDDRRAKSTLERATEQRGAGGGREGELSSACDALWQGMLVVDDRARVKYTNGAAAVLMRAKREELIGADFAVLAKDDKVLEAVRGVAEGRVRSRNTVEVERKGEQGSSVLRFTVRPVRRNDAGSALVVIEDVTQQRVADKARNSFVAQATHELRTPLTNIRLYVESLLEEPDQDAAKRASAINVISQETRRLERLVGDMLNVAEIDAGSMKLHTGDVRPEAIFAELEQEFLEAAKKKDLTLRFELPPKWPLVRGDRDKIVMAAHNLLGNAVKYTPAGGEVTVRVGFESDTLSIDVQDNGIGIKPEEQEMVFEKFYRAKDRRIATVTGTGLGLAIAREVVRLHGGDITLHSQVDKGSTFTMTLPAKAA